MTNTLKLMTILTLMISGCSSINALTKEVAMAPVMEVTTNSPAKEDCYRSIEADFLYDDAYTITHNQMDDDHDEFLDEADEVLLLVRPEWSDGIDNNQDGSIDEPYEFAPRWFVTVCYTSFVSVEEINGMVVTTETYQTITTREPYYNQVIDDNVIDSTSIKN